MSERRDRPVSCGDRLSWRARALALLAVTSTIVIAHAPVLGAFFVSDDFVLIEAVSRFGPLGVWSSHGESFFRPLASISFHLDWLAFGLSPAGFHGTSLAIHCLNALLVGWIAARVFLREGAPDVAFGISGALVFGLLPSHSEAVCWISARGDLIATLGGLAAIAAFIGYRTTGRRTLLALAFAAYGSSLLAKESLVLLPGIVFSLDRLRFHSGLRESLRGASGFVVVAVLYVALRSWTIGQWLGGYGAAEHLNWDAGAANLFYYPLRSLTPALQSGAWLAACIVAGLLLAGLALISVRTRNRSHAVVALGFAVAFLLAAAPVLTLGVGRETVEGERFLYGPSTVTCIAVLGLMARIRARRTRAFAFAAVAVLAFVATWHAASTWGVAGRIARETVEGLVDLPQAERVWVGPLHDDRVGAYVFRNGVEASIRLFDRDEVRNTLVVAPARWHQRFPHYTLDVRITDAGREIQARASGGSLSLLDARPPGIEVIEHERHWLRLRLPEAHPGDLVVAIDARGVTHCRPMHDCPR